MSTFTPFLRRAAFAATSAALVGTSALVTAQQDNNAGASIRSVLAGQESGQSFFRLACPAGSSAILAVRSPTGDSASAPRTCFAPAEGPEQCTTNVGWNEMKRRACASSDSSRQ